MLAGILMALVSGIAVGLQSVFNLALEKHIGLAGLMLWLHFIGFIVAVPVVLLVDPGAYGKIFSLRTAGLPFYVLLGGVLGLIVVPGVTFAIQRSDPAITFSVIMIGQLVIALVMQQFGLLGVERANIHINQMLGLGLIVIGVGVYFWRGS
ncbi:MAG: DMT family transporter [Anaerolineae bacterium]|nr:DMT family transporter [Anaerolineae bacterium]